jgi:DNA polymerase III subunit delta
MFLFFNPMIYLFFGDDDFRSKEKLFALKKKFLEGTSAASGLSDFDFEEKDSFREFLDAVKTPNMLAPKRFVIARSLLGSARPEQQEELLVYLKKEKSILDDKDLVIALWEEKIAANNKLFQWLKKNTKVQEFENLSGFKIEQWVLKRIADVDEKTKIDKDALSKLIIFTGGSTRILSNEILKLINNSSDGKIISRDVDEMVRADLDAKIFDTIDALGDGRKKTALELLHRHLEKGDDPFYIFSMFVYQFRNLIKVDDCLRREIYDEKAIAKETGLHPYVVKKSRRQLQNFSHEKLIRTYRKLAQADIMVKTGKIDIRLAMEKLIVEM